MTIAACYVVPEGVVLGADSTSTFAPKGEFPHHFNYAQKVYEVGEHSTLGIVTWGLGNLVTSSYRTLIAEFSDQIAARPPESVLAATHHWAGFFFRAFEREAADLVARARALAHLPTRSPQEEEEYKGLRALGVGFCLGGRIGDRSPAAASVWVSPEMPAPRVEAVPRGLPFFWGSPNVMDRLILGVDPTVLDRLAAHPKWSGTRAELQSVLFSSMLMPPGNQHLPLREAIDWVHSAIYTTIKAFKFSQFSPICGGPIEIAVVSSDRPFRWVMHKRFDAAIGQPGRPETT